MRANRRRASWPWLCSLSVLLLLAVPARGAGADAKTTRLWQAKCAACHGDDGAGQTAKGKEMGVRSMKAATWQAELTDDKIRAAVRDGVKQVSADGKKQEMDGFADKLKPEQIDALVGYVRTLGPAPAAGAPAPAPAVPAPAPAPAAPGAAPAAPAKELVARGKKLFAAKCSSCHGKDGKGKTTQGKKLGVGDMTSADWQSAHSSDVIAAALAPGAKVKAKAGEVKHVSAKLAPRDVEALSAWLKTLGAE